MTFNQYRKSQTVRDQYAEVTLQACDFILPYFVVDGENQKQTIPLLPEVYRFSIDLLLIDLKETIALGIDKIILFGVIDAGLKDTIASYAYKPNNLIVRAIKAIKAQYPNIIVITDICLCAYTNHGHCGILNNKNIDVKASLPILANMALSHAQAGANIVAPSAMIDEQVAAIKNILNTNNMLSTQILGYSAKFASVFYGPFRHAANSSPAFGDRKTYQIDYRTVKQPLNEIAADIAEQANWVMVKPAHTYLDVICRAKQQFTNTPLVAYQVSGEYAMIVAAANAGLFNAHDAQTEALFAIKRAGADFIISYYAKAFLMKVNNGLIE